MTFGPWTQHKDFPLSIMSGKHCVTSINIGNQSMEQATAYARLIAAAPELLMALEDMYVIVGEAMIDGSISPWRSLEQAHDKAYAAISKAKGES